MAEIYYAAESMCQECKRFVKHKPNGGPHKWHGCRLRWKVSSGTALTRGEKRRTTRSVTHVTTRPTPANPAATRHPCAPNTPRRHKAASDQHGRGPRRFSRTPMFDTDYDPQPIRPKHCTSQKYEPGDLMPMLCCLDPGHTGEHRSSSYGAVGLTVQCFYWTDDADAS